MQTKFDTNGLVTIDGSYGEGGGQILRTSLTLSALTGRALDIANIRAGRPKPGLMPQHMVCGQAVVEITGGKIEGNAIGSSHIRFFPSCMSGGKYRFDVSSVKKSAGSTCLIFQTVLPALSFVERPSHIIIDSGTHVPWSPCFDDLEGVFLPVMRDMGLNANLSCSRIGFYPAGCGEMESNILPARRPLKPIKLIDRGKLRRIKIFSAVANLPISIADRQRNRASSRIMDRGFDVESEIIEAPSCERGTYIFILAEFENTKASFSAIGAVGKRAEMVADEAVDGFMQFIDGSGALDKHLADQVLIYMALASGESTITTTEITRHLLTNIWVIEQFLPVKFLFDKVNISVKGIGYA